MEKSISIEWSSEDVQSIRPDLNDEQAYEVLLMVEKYHDAEIGVNWNVLSAVADEYFPEPNDEDEDDEDDDAETRICY